MCGIAGYYSQKPYGKDILTAPLDALHHRGPDSSGIYESADKHYRGGMRRLSINDLAGGDQPLYNEDKTVALVYNGEIYNYNALRSELETLGHEFKTRSDGETICHLYEEYGVRLFEKLDGMFAAALWDAKSNKLVLARDIPGEKPLYYSKLPDGELAFSSEIKSLRTFPGIDLGLHFQAIWDLPTFLWVPEPDTIYKNIQALPPGHLLVVDQGEVTIEKYKNAFESSFDFHAANDSEIIREVRTTVEDAITSRLLSDVPIGSFLSGGLDSSIVATVAKRNVGELSTFCIGFKDATGIQSNQFGKIADESTYAADYAKRIGSKHTTIHVTQKEFLHDLEEFAKYGDQPWGVSSGLGVRAVSKVARALNLKVLLTGDGADECFGGYPWYATLKQDSPLSAELARSSHYYATESDKRSLFNMERFEGAQDSLRWFTQYKASDWSPKDFVTHDRLFYQPNEMLRKADRMTMEHSVEGRVPFVAPRVLALSDALPFNALVRNGTLKWVLREAFADLIPTETIKRPKQGFNIPIDQWLSTEWAHLIEETFSTDSELYRQGIITSDSQQKAKQMLDEKDRLNGHTIFCYIMLNKWLTQNHN